ncbi:hypothetical protein [Thermococcus sp.]|uniref:hypothetical protein n=1 Tax=Thermococcus sp. TaxID=35749 RepID=UPI00260B1F2A|nr:hypothetical protein [Thermococcus sp.]
MKWKPLFAVLLGLLMVGVTAGSAAATSTPENSIENPVRPMIFGDKSELHLSFEPYLSYVYRGRIYLAYHWEWDHTEKIIDGPNDYIVITLPWQVYVDKNGHIKSGIDTPAELEKDIDNHNGHWEDLFYMEQPVIEVSPLRVVLKFYGANNMVTKKDQGVLV